MKRKNLKTTTYKRGPWAEALCGLVLRLKFYRIIARRYKTGLGEIDIIAARGRTLVIIEVKARRTRENAAAAISERQQSRLIRAASVFLAHHPFFQSHDIRFDAMLVSPWGWPVHLENAFHDHPQLF